MSTVRDENQPPAVPGPGEEPLAGAAPRGPQQASPAHSPLPGLGAAFVAALLAVAVNQLVPTLSALLVAILLGVLVANLHPLPGSTAPGIAVASKRVLRIGIVLLGLQLSLRDILGLGAGMIAVVVAVVLGGFATAELLGRALGIRPAQRSLIGAGFSICGAAAVAGVEGVIDDKHEEDVVTAIALVVLFGTLMIPLVPLAGGAMGLDQRTNGLWAGASTHEVAQVVAAAGIIGPAALKVGVVTKLARVLMLAPVMVWFGWRQRRRGGHVAGKRPPLVPLFVAGFLAATVLRTTGWVPGGVLDVVKVVQTFCLAAAMFGLGTGVRFATLRAVGGRPLLLAAGTTAAVAGIGLAGVLWAG